MSSLPHIEDDLPEALRLAWHQEEAEAIRAEAEAEYFETRGAAVDLSARHQPEPTTGWISVKQLADAIGRTVGTTRNLLDLGLIPGAERKTPGLPNSPWLIPPTSPNAFKLKEK
jgi:hypothetical protein